MMASSLPSRSYAVLALFAAAILVAILAAGFAGDARAEDADAKEEAPPLPTAPVNLDFEAGRTGRVPLGWEDASRQGSLLYKVELSSDRWYEGDLPYEGRLCAKLSSAGFVQRDRAPEEGEREPDPSLGGWQDWKRHRIMGQGRDEIADLHARGEPNFGALIQRFDAADYRGRIVCFHAALRAVVSRGKGRVQLFAQVERPGGPDDFSTEPVPRSQWQELTLPVEVAGDATAVVIGLNLIGMGRAWLDAVSFDVVGSPAAAAPGPRVEAAATGGAAPVAAGTGEATGTAQPPDPALTTPAGPAPRAGLPAISRLRPGLFHVDLARADAGRFEEALPLLASADGILFDLRGGGAMELRLLDLLEKGALAGRLVFLWDERLGDGGDLAAMIAAAGWGEVVGVGAGVTVPLDPDEAAQSKGRDPIFDRGLELLLP